MTTTPKRTLTPHQREVYNRVRRMTGRHIPSLAAIYVGSEGALRKLEAKGYVVLTNRPGPRGGEHLFVSLP